jgi:hypothetical protein
MRRVSPAEAKSEPHGLISRKSATLQGVSVTWFYLNIGAKWSNDLKNYARTSGCGKVVDTSGQSYPHVALVLSCTLKVVMDNGEEQDFSKDDVVMLPSGHDAWAVGEELGVFEVLESQ